MKRREAVRAIAVAAGAGVLAPFVNLGRYRVFGASTVEYSARCIKLMQEATVLDMLGVLTIHDEWLEWAKTPSPLTEEKFRRYKDSGINVFHHSFGMGGYGGVVSFCNSVNAMIAGNSRYFSRIDTPEHLKTVKSSGKVGILVGVQNSAHFRTIDDVDLFYGLGQRVSQLTYNSPNRIGVGSTSADTGITEFGAAIVAQMNAAGMAVDVSHCGDRTTMDAFRISKQPVLVTHSNCRALNPGHPRCKPDEVIREVGRTGSVFGITGVRMFVKRTEPTTIEHVIDQFDHVKKLIGSEHLGVGSDMDLDGYDDLPAAMQASLRRGYDTSYAFRDKIDIEGLDHPKRMFDLTEALIRRKYSDNEIRGILGGNFTRVLTQIWSARTLGPVRVPNLPPTPARRDTLQRDLR
jgi:membrane dipeptidase